jgi:hypothetical protein
MKISKTLLLAVALLVVLGTLAGCATTYKTTNGALSYGNTNGAAAGAFEAQGNVRYIIHPSLISLAKDNEQLDFFVEPQLAKMGAKGIKNVEIVAGFDTMGFLIRYFTGILGWEYVKVTGEAVK